MNARLFIPAPTSVSTLLEATAVSVLKAFTLWMGKIARSRAVSGTSFNFLSSKHVILIGMHVLFLFIKRVLFLAYPDLSCILRIIMVEFQR